MRWRRRIESSAVHLPLDHLRLAVRALGPAVVKRQDEGSDDGQRVKFQAAQVLIRSSPTSCARP
jgi:hypothetical protein